MNRLPPILLAEDEDDDIVLLEHAFAQAGIQNPLIVVRDGEDVIQYLKGEGRYADRAKFPLPCVLLLDMKMPRLTGHQVLAWFRRNPEWHDKLPVVGISSSELPIDVKPAFELGIRDYLVKPCRYDKLVELMRFFKSRWLDKK